jgi:hypothetical protein
MHLYSIYASVRQIIKLRITNLSTQNLPDIQIEGVDLIAFFYHLTNITVIVTRLFKHNRTTHLPRTVVCSWFHNFTVTDKNGATVARLDVEFILDEYAGVWRRMRGAEAGQVDEGPGSEAEAKQP